MKVRTEFLKLYDPDYDVILTKVMISIQEEDADPPICKTRFLFPKVEKALSFWHEVYKDDNGVIHAFTYCQPRSAKNAAKYARSLICAEYMREYTRWMKIPTPDAHTYSLPPDRIEEEETEDEGLGVFRILDDKEGDDE